MYVCIYIYMYVLVIYVIMCAYAVCDTVKGIKVITYKEVMDYLWIS
jgi:hypothetical protein